MGGDVRRHLKVTDWFAGSDRKLHVTEFREAEPYACSEVA